MAKKLVIVLFLFVFCFGFISIKNNLRNDYKILPREGHQIYSIIKNDFPGFPTQNGKNITTEKHYDIEIPVILETKFERVAKEEYIVTLTKTMETEDLVGTNAISFWKYRIYKDNVELVENMVSGLIGNPHK